jgi:hypothetical protein
MKPSIYGKTMTSGWDDRVACRLIEMGEFSDTNNGYNYLLSTLGCFSKFACCKLL